MTQPITLSSCRIDPDSGIRRQSPRPPHLRNADYDARFDFDTLFYDVYRAGPHVVFQGPPLHSLLDHLRQSTPFKGRLGFPRFSARHYGPHKRGEIWLRSDTDRVLLDGPLGRHDLPVQPDMAPLFAGRRVVTTQSKDNGLRWISDWVRFYRRVHGADGFMVYDNASTRYTVAEVQAALDAEAEGCPAVAVDWPFPYGPQGGLPGAINGVETPWDSDFCQIGSLQHARFRFLRQAASVLNVDIDELVLPVDGQSIFAAAEASPGGFVKFAGVWIGTATGPGVTRQNCRHGDFIYRLAADEPLCTPKYCVVPGRSDPRKVTWSVHNLFGSRHNAVVDGRFLFRHMRGISNSWKEDRWQQAAPGDIGDLRDDDLAKAFDQAGLLPAQPLRLTA